MSCIQLFRTVLFALLAAGATAVTVVLYSFELPAAESKSGHRIGVPASAPTVSITAAPNAGFEATDIPGSLAAVLKATITVQSVNGFAGSLNLAVSCCYDVMAGANTESSFADPITPVSFDLPPNGQYTWPISLILHQSPMSAGSCDPNQHSCPTWKPHFGTFLAVITLTGSYTEGTNFSFYILPGGEKVLQPSCSAKADCGEYRPSCWGTGDLPELIPLGPDVKLLADTMVGTTGNDEFVYFFQHLAPGPAAIKWNVQEDPTLPYHQSRITFVDDTDDKAGMAGVSLPECGGAYPALTYGKPAQTVLIDAFGTSGFQGPDTLAFSRVNGNPPPPMEPLAVFGQEAFWFIAGGRNITITYCRQGTPCE
jgi:hypothetical protein